MLAEHGNPVADLHGAGPQIAAAVIAHVGDVRRFRNAAAFARFCGAAPIPCGSGQTAGRHRLHRGGNRQLNAALYRIAIVQARHHSPARAYLARNIADQARELQAASATICTLSIDSTRCTCMVILLAGRKGLDNLNPPCPGGHHPPAQTRSQALNERSGLGLEGFVHGELFDVRRPVHFDAGCCYCLLDPRLEGIEVLA